MDISKKTKDTIFLLIRLTLIISIVANILIPFFAYLHGSNFIEGILKNGELIFFGIITLILSFGSDYIEKKNNIHIPEIFEIIIVLFIYAALFLSVNFNLYYRLFWWDDLLHTLSGVIIGLIGFITMHKINHKYKMNISPLLIMLFSFCLAVTIGVFWEIYEFLLDIFLGTANQKWNLPSTEIMIGKPYQGSGLRDTMSDLIVNCIGAATTSIIAYFTYKKNKSTRNN